MKKVLLLILTLPILALNAQIFINTNPNSNKGTIVKTEPKKVDETKKEIHTTKTKVEDYKTKVTSPNYKSSTNVNVGGTNVSGTTSTGNVVSGTKSINTNTGGGTTVTGSSSTTSNSFTSSKSSTISGTSSNSYSGTTSYSGSNDDVPPNAQPGKCYARCQSEDQYAYNTKSVINTPKMVKRIKLPALYTTVYDTVVIKPQSTRTERIPAQYETIRQQKMVSPTTTKWVKGKANAGCLSADPNDCQVMCLVEVPAQYTTVSKKVLKHEAYSRTITVPMEYKIVAKQVKTQNERYTEQVIPATYKNIQERVLVKKGGYQGWREILCGSDLTSSKISSIQRALKAAGFNPGPIDNVFGTKTKEALKSYQRAKGLPVGNLNLETLKSLGV